MSLFIALGVIYGIGVLFVILSILGYRDRVRWYQDFDEKNPGVAEKLGVKPRRRIKP